MHGDGQKKGKEGKKEKGDTGRWVAGARFLVSEEGGTQIFVPHLYIYFRPIKKGGS